MFCITGTVHNIGYIMTGVAAEEIWARQFTTTTNTNNNNNNIYLTAIGLSPGGSGYFTCI
jgi:hypothetical protein